MKISLILLIISTLWLKGNSAIIEFNVKNYGADPSGAKNSYFAIQKVINMASKAEGEKRIIFPKGKYLIYDNSLVIWGSNIELIGIDEVTLEKRGSAGWWGDLLDISGLVNGHKYYGLKNNSFSIYNGKNIPSSNIKIKNFIFTTNSSQISPLANNVGIINSKNLYFDNCKFLNAPQTNLAIVNDMRYFSNYNININNCFFSGAGDHNVRVISYEKGRNTNNSVFISNSSFSNVKRHSNLKELKSNTLHIWYRAGANPNSNLVISNCNFDSTGDIIATINGKGLNVKNSKIGGKLIYEDGLLTDISILGNSFSRSPQSSVKINKRSSLNQFSRENKFQ
ncbi:glycoside hydrolase family 55 protein [Sphingobacterium daejeonense]|uniref:glycoside hydrolase family 55 protein n=1 Tax=Sphingobacterium daejeonense TaxID=371142 RepID=UPI0021A80FA8|nr:glycoside hydrolase family 55 protein [Sphingobacterium daejeonense]MCT1532639.1 glycoside hydrolase family 55 protein [Sphingobacterium daejeonense]